VAVVLVVRRDGPPLCTLVEPLRAQLQDREWRLRLVVGAAAGEAVRPAHELASSDPRIAVTGLTVDGPIHAALAHGLLAEADADAWVCLEADRPAQPGVLRLVLGRLEQGGVDAVLAVRSRLRWRLVAAVAGRLPAPAAARLMSLSAAGPWAAVSGGRDAVLAAGPAGALAALTGPGVRLLTVPEAGAWG
jgi:hypothetical protein